MTKRSKATSMLSSKPWEEILKSRSFRILVGTIFTIFTIRAGARKQGIQDRAFAFDDTYSEALGLMTRSHQFTYFKTDASQKQQPGKVPFEEWCVNMPKVYSPQKTHS